MVAELLLKAGANHSAIDRVSESYIYMFYMFYFTFTQVNDFYIFMRGYWTFSFWNLNNQLNILLSFDLHVYTIFN